MQRVLAELRRSANNDPGFRNFLTSGRRLTERLDGQGDENFTSRANVNDAVQAHDHGLQLGRRRVLNELRQAARRDPEFRSFIAAGAPLPSLRRHGGARNGLMAELRQAAREDPDFENFRSGARPLARRNRAARHRGGRRAASAVENTNNMVFDTENSDTEELNHAEQKNFTAQETELNESSSSSGSANLRTRSCDQMEEAAFLLGSSSCSEDEEFDDSTTASCKQVAAVDATGTPAHQNKESSTNGEDSTSAVDTTRVPETLINFRVTTMSGDDHVLKLPGTKRVKHLKRAILRQVGFSIHPRLCVGDKILDDDVLLQDAKISEDDLESSGEILHFVNARQINPMTGQELLFNSTMLRRQRRLIEAKHSEVQRQRASN